MLLCLADCDGGVSSGGGGASIGDPLGPPLLPAVVVSGDPHPLVFVVCWPFCGFGLCGGHRQAWPLELLVGTLARRRHRRAFPSRPPPPPLPGMIGHHSSPLRPLHCPWLLLRLQLARLHGFQFKIVWKKYGMVRCRCFP